MRLTGRGVLGLPEDADAAAVQAAFRRLAKLIHPDVNANEAATEMMRIVVLARDSALATEPAAREEPSGTDACDVVVTFGKYEGWRIGELVLEKTQYAFWVLAEFSVDSGWRHIFLRAVDDVLSLKHGYTSRDRTHVERAWEWARRERGWDESIFERAE